METFQGKRCYLGDSSKNASVKPYTASVDLEYNQVVTLDPNDPTKVIPYTAQPGEKVCGYVLHNRTGSLKDDVVDVQMDELVSKCYSDTEKYLKGVTCTPAGIVTFTMNDGEDFDADLSKFLDNVNTFVKEVTCEPDGKFVITLTDGQQIAADLSKFLDDTNTFLKEVTCDDAGLLTFTLTDGTSTTADLSKFLDNTDNFLKGVACDATGKITFTMQDGTTITEDLSKFLDNVDTKVNSVTCDATGNITIGSSDGSSVSADLSKFLDNTDDFLTGITCLPSGITTFTKSSGATVIQDFSKFFDNTDKFLVSGDCDEGVITLELNDGTEVEIDTNKPPQVEFTRAQLLVKKAASDLIPGQIYIVTNPSVPASLAGADIAIEATREDQLAGEGQLILPAQNDCSNWEVHYDIIRNRIDRLHDHDRNVEIEGVSVYTFPWGTTLVRDVIVMNNSTYTYSSGNTVGLEVNNSSTVLQRGGDLLGVSVKDGSYLQADGGSIQQTTIHSDGYARFLAGATGTVRYTEISTGADVFFDSWSGIADRNTFSNNARVYMATSGGTVSDNTINRGYLYARNSPALAVTGNVVDSLGYLWVEANTTGSVAYNTISSRGYVLLSGSTGLFQYNNIDSYGYWYSLNSAARIRFNNLSANGYIYTDRNTADSIFERNSIERGYVNVRNSAARVYDNQVNSYSLIYGYNNPNLYTLQYNEFTSISRLYAYNTFAGNFNNNEMTSDSYVYVFQSTGASVIRRNSYAAFSRTRYTHVTGTSEISVFARLATTIATATTNQVIGY